MTVEPNMDAADGERAAVGAATARSGFAKETTDAFVRAMHESGAAGERYPSFVMVSTTAAMRSVSP